MTNFKCFITAEIKYHPASRAYLEFWKAEKRKCIEGVWINGTYMPGKLYFYINYWHIKLSENKNAKSQIVAKPFCRDIDWRIAYVRLASMGFSGFKDDVEFTADEEFKEAGVDDSGRKYLPAFKYLLKQAIADKDLGKPLYLNQAKNVLDLRSRGGGKSFGMSADIGHTWLFDGAIDYDEYLRLREAGNPLSAVAAFGAIDSKYSNDLMKKVQLGLEKLPGKRTIGNRNYPSPFDRSWYGSFASGKSITTGFMMNYDGRQDTEGTKSEIHHRVFKDNPSAMSGMRANLIVVEEVGFMNNLLQALGQMKNATEVSGYKFGTIYMMGTGGENDSTAIAQLKEVFYNPEEWDCLGFEDEFEESNLNEICMFIPCHWGDTHFMNRESGVINREASYKHHEAEREKLKKGNPQSFHNEIINNCFTYKEAFFLKTGSIFPTQALSDQLAFLETQTKDDRYEGLNGRLDYTIEGKLEFTREHTLPVPWPLPKGHDTSGCITIWEQPEKDKFNNIAHNLYIAGFDPIDQDSGTSLASLTIFKRFIVGIEGAYDWPVATYNARLEFTDDVYENVIKLLDYYNATCLYENMLKGFKTYAQNKYKLHRLATSPTTFKATAHSKVDRTYGIHMNDTIKTELELYTRDWLNMEYEPGKRNLTKIYDKNLLKELIAYNRDINTDRVISFMLAIGQRKEIENIRITPQVIEEVFKPFRNRLFV